MTQRYNNSVKTSDHNTCIQKEDEKFRLQYYDFFKSFAPSYDLSNQLFSLGTVTLIRDKFVSIIKPTANIKLIDMAAGTGNLTYPLISYIQKNKISNCHITACDLNEEMLDIGRKKFQNVNYDSNLIAWVKDDAENLSFVNDSFDVYVTAFGIRCMVHFDKVVDEACRILKPGGKFFCLDIGHIKNPIIRWFRNFYAYYVLPIFGFFLGGNSHNFFLGTIDRFPDEDTFEKLLKEAGFENITYENVWFGAFVMCKAEKPY